MMLRPLLWLVFAATGCSDGAGTEFRSSVSRADAGTEFRNSVSRGDTELRNSVPAAPSRGDTELRNSVPIVTDAAFGRLVGALSEPAGEFPSDNYVSNETTVLDAAPALAEAGLAGRAYIGVGPEQNFTYVALTRPAIAYVLDIRRGNLLEHLVLRAAMQDAESPGSFLAALTARPDPPAGAALADVLAALGAGRGEVPRRDALVAKTEALAGRLGIPLSPQDRDDVRGVAQAFFEHGTSLRYSMTGANRPYPTLSELLGQDGTFVADPTAYGFVRDLVRSNRVVPVVGDFAGPHALRAIGVDMAARGLTLGAFYTSNVEEYLFQGGSFEAFRASVATLPSDERSLFVRVWFDRSRPHPLQREGQRMATVVMPVARMLARPPRRPYRSYWQVITDGLPDVR